MTHTAAYSHESGNDSMSRHAKSDACHPLDSPRTTRRTHFVLPKPLPPSSRLIFSSGVSLVVDMENAPCRYPGDIIEKHHSGKRHLFAKAAQGLRGSPPGLSDRVRLR